MIHQVVSSVNPRLSPSSSRLLDTPFSAEDVRVALFNMGPSKASVLDGFPVDFFQKNWETIGSCVVEACLGCLNGNAPLVSINKMLITLIPKVANTDKMSNFRPIRSLRLRYMLFEAVNC
ncbi:hypothetical protein ACOSQ2_006856 [Xanthoceras sorbifolium]